jgi:hypothetical protein
MVFQGHIENGVAIFDEPAGLPDGMKVQIVPIVDAAVSASSGKTLAERFKDIVGAAKNLPEDMAENHDHYLHGTPKK